LWGEEGGGLAALGRDKGGRKGRKKKTQDLPCISLYKKKGKERYRADLVGGIWRNTLRGTSHVAKKKKGNFPPVGGKSYCLSGLMRERERMISTFLKNGEKNYAEKRRSEGRRERPIIKISRGGVSFRGTGDVHGVCIGGWGWWGVLGGGVKNTFPVCEPDSIMKRDQRKYTIKKKR